MNKLINALDLLAEGGQEPLEGEDSVSAGRNMYRAILGIRSVHYMAIFALIYIGTEVTLGGMVVTSNSRFRSSDYRQAGS